MTDKNTELLADDLQDEPRNIDPTQEAELQGGLTRKGTRLKGKTLSGETRGIVLLEENESV